MHARTHAQAHAHRDICTHTRTHARTRTRAHARAHERTHAHHTNIRQCARTHAHIHTHTSVKSSPTRSPVYETPGPLFLGIRCAAPATTKALLFRFTRPPPCTTSFCGETSTPRSCKGRRFRPFRPCRNGRASSRQPSSVPEENEASRRESEPSTDCPALPNAHHRNRSFGLRRWAAGGRRSPAPRPPQNALRGSALSCVENAGHEAD